MPVYKYQAKELEGKIQDGLIEAPSEINAIGMVKDQGLKLLSIKMESAGGAGSSVMVLGGVGIKDIVIFTRQFSVLISAKVTMVEALKVLVEQTEHLKLKMEVSKIYDEVDAGSSLSDALSKRPRIFDPFFVNVVRAGEVSGKLDDVLNYLADEMEKNYDMQGKIKGAMIYPAFVLTGMLGAGIFMMVFVVPKLTDVLAESGMELPITTKILIATSAFMTKYWFIVIAGVFGLFALVKVINRTDDGKRFFDMIKLRLPIFGNLFRLIYLVRFTSAMHTLVVGGVSVTKSLQITSEVVDNYVFKDLITETIKEVEDGNSISLVFASTNLIPKMVSQMMAIGEKTGRLDLIFERSTIFYSREISNIVANMTAIMEPLIMLIMGVGVGVMVAAVIMPMYQMASAF